MRNSRRSFLRYSLASALALLLPRSTRSADAAEDAIDLDKNREANLGDGTLPPPETTPGPFQPAWESLAQYEVPDWFRDAKFGIWCAWSAQCVPEQGDWYARGMYQQGSAQYQYHCAHYGHPSKVGFKDIDRIWGAENWNPEKMIALYKAAGAKYFVAMANHHDNFDTWDSKYQPWNAVNIGPRKDIIGTWAKAARHAGMHFGVSVHASHTWNWWEVAQGADKTGPLAGVPYDGKLTKADGAGQWWEGYDPQDLYAQNHPVGGGGWEMEGSTAPPSKAYCEKFYNRTVDLIHQHNPDLVYFDDSGLPLHATSDVGLRLAAEYYNFNLKQHGKLGAVLNTKVLTGDQSKCVVMDIERGRSADILPTPWQSDTCIGDWHYKREIFEKHAYKTTRQVVHTLVDVVSKNGNLLLNIPMRGDGTIDADEIAFLKGMAGWVAINGPSIFNTRPWKISGEGPTASPSGAFHEGGVSGYTEHDFRFSTSGDTLFVTCFGWPQDKFVITSLALNAPGIVGEITDVAMMGLEDDLAFLRTTSGLEVNVPDQRPGHHAWVMAIDGLDLDASHPVAPTAAPPKPEA